MKTRALISVFVTTLLATSLGARADVVTDWNGVALDAIRADKTSPTQASRNLAILHVAIYDAVNGIRQRNERKFQPYLVKKKGHRKLSEEAAASAAAHLVLNALYPAQQTTFDGKYAEKLAGIEDGKPKTRGIGYGEFVANTILAARADDGSSGTVDPPSGSGPGFWVPTPPAFAAYLSPQWGFVEPFALTNGSQFLPPGPPSLDSARWVADYNEIQELGSAISSTRTAEQTEIANFWADGAGTETPPGHWNRIAHEVAAAQGNTLDENARLFALLNIALADAAICAWDAKYIFNFWRPITAIRSGDTDGNDATVADTTWTSLIVTPPFPDYVSGHSTYSGAASTVLTLFYGTDHIAFTIDSDFLPGVFRSFDSFAAAADEAALSRLYGGIHFRFANEDGLNSGRKIGVYVTQNFLLLKGKGRK